MDSWRDTGDRSATGMLLIDSHNAPSSAQEYSLLDMQLGAFEGRGGWNTPQGRNPPEFCLVSLPLVGVVKRD